MKSLKFKIYIICERNEIKTAWYKNTISNYNIRKNIEKEYNNPLNRISRILAMQ